nr:nucleotide-binding alpha-beta plait domain-containing protein [Tanacetum cinerariifolium]
MGDKEWTQVKRKSQPSNENDMSGSNEGFTDIKIQYLGEFWVMLSFMSVKSLRAFRDNVSVGSWFTQVKQATMDFTTEERIAWVEVEGIPFKLWSGNTFKRVAAKWGRLLDIDDQEDECFHSKRLCIHTKKMGSIDEDFKICYQGKVFLIRAKEMPGWVPDFLNDSEDDERDEEEYKDGESKNEDNGIGGNVSDEEEVPDTVFETMGDNSGNEVKGGVKSQVVASEDPFNIYSLLNDKKEKEIKNAKSDDSMEYPPGFTPADHNEDNAENLCKVEHNSLPKKR